MKLFIRIILLLILLALIGIAAIIFIPVQHTKALDSDIDQSEVSIERGEYLMRASNCLSCHTAPEGADFAGGLAIDSPLGKIYSTNITPDKDTGIGDYSLDEFRASLYDGIRKDGAYLYPAMPYENYRHLTEVDVQSLYKYFMEGVKAVENDVPKTNLGFPFNQRWGIRAWNWLALDEASFKPTTDDKQLNRGAYLVQGPAHCAACHSPRTAFMAQDGLNEKDQAFLSGGNVEGWDAPDLHGEDSVISQWSLEQIAHYLETGRNDHATSVGAMADVVGDSLQYLKHEDNLAIAAYLKYITGSVDKTTLEDNAKDHTETEKLLTSADPSMPLGARLYLDNCAGCHFVNGQGASEIFPKLDGNVLVTANSPTGLIHTILYGAELPSTEKRPARLRMQGYDWRLSDSEVAELATFIRQAWHNDAESVSEGQVSELRKD